MVVGQVFLADVVHVLLAKDHEPVEALLPDGLNESLAGKRYPKPMMRISGRDDAGKLLPLVISEAADPEDAGGKNVMG